MFLQRHTDFLGLHADGRQLYHVAVRRGLGKWLPGEPVGDNAVHGVCGDGSPRGLRQFLDRLAPRRGRAIYLSLPRRFFFFRHLELPPMPLEDALAAVETSLPVSSHLPVEEIFYDIHLCPLADKRIHGLLIYARRQEISPYLEAFRDTGHGRSLEGLMPYIVGLGGWLAFSGYYLPLGLVCGQGEEREVAVYTPRGTAYTAVAGELDDAALEREVRGRYPEIGPRFYRLLAGAENTLPAPPGNKPAFLPPVAANPALAALGPRLAGQQPVAVDDRPVRLRQLQPAPVLAAAALFLLLLCGLLTWSADYRGRRLEKRLQVVKAENLKLEQRLKPLQQKQQLSKKSAAVLRDVEDFLRLRPRMYSCLNDIARRLPEGTWFNSLTFRRGSLTMRGQSPDALKVVEALRQSEFFTQVKLQGTVSKTRDQRERFSLSLQLRMDEDEPAQKTR